MNWKKVSLYLVSILILIFVSLWASKPLLIDYVDHKLKSELKDGPIQYFGLRISIFPISISLDSLHYLDKAKQMQVRLYQVDVSNIHLLPYLKNKALQIDQILIQKLNANLVNSSKQDSSNKHVNKKSFPFKKINVQKFQLNAGNAFLLDPTKDSVSTLISGTQLSLDEIELDSDRIKSLRFNKLKFEVDSLNHFGKKVAIKTGKILMDKSKMLVNDFELKDQLPPDFAFQKTKYDIKVKSTELNYQLDSLLSKKSYRFSLLKANQFEMISSLDKRKPRKGEIKPSLAKVLDGIPIAFSLDSISISQGYINYKEFVSQAPYTSEVYFKNVALESNHFTNDKAEIERSKWFKNKATCLFLGKAPLKCQINFNLASEASDHHLKGQLEKLPFQQLNPILEPLVAINFKSGVSDKLLFNFRGNYSRSKGNVKFYYVDLKIQFHGQDKSTTKEFFRSIAGGLANTFLIRSDNPQGNHFKEGEINFERDHSKSIFNFWWKSIFSGMTETALKVDPQKLK